MAEHEDLLRDILAEPAETNRMLVYADWLEERDDPRASYLRLQVELRESDDEGLLERIRRVYPSEHPAWLGRLEQAGVVRANLTALDDNWWGVGLGARESDSTYTRFGYHDQPPLPVERFDHSLTWLKETELGDGGSETAPSNDEWAQAFSKLEGEGRFVPASLKVIMGDYALQNKIPSCTANYFMSADVAEPFDLDGGAIFYPFYSDQQAVVIWGVRLGPAGERYAPVVAGPPHWSEDTDYSEAPSFPDLTFQAPSVETFLFRTWIENHIWYALNMDERDLTSDEQAYMDHLNRRAGESSEDTSA